MAVDKKAVVFVGCATVAGLLWLLVSDEIGSPRSPRDTSRGGSRDLCPSDAAANSGGDGVPAYAAYEPQDTSSVAEAAPPALAARPATFAGRVVNDHGSPVARGVVLVQPEAGFHGVTRLDEVGRFAFFWPSSDALPPRETVVVVRADGFFERKFSGERLPGDWTSRQDLLLNVGPPSPPTAFQVLWLDGDPACGVVAVPVTADTLLQAATVDAEGRLRFPPWSEDRLPQAIRFGWGTSAPSLLTVDLQSLVGTVVRLPSFRVAIEAAAEQVSAEPLSYANLSISAHGTTRLLFTDAAGRFAAVGLAPDTDYSVDLRVGTRAVPLRRMAGAGDAARDVWRLPKAIAPNVLLVAPKLACGQMPIQFLGQLDDAQFAMRAYGQGVPAFLAAGQHAVSGRWEWGYAPDSTVYYQFDVIEQPDVTTVYIPGWTSDDSTQVGDPVLLDITLQYHDGTIPEFVELHAGSSPMQSEELLDPVARMHTSGLNRLQPETRLGRLQAWMARPKGQLWLGIGTPRLRRAFGPYVVETEQAALHLDLRLPPPPRAVGVVMDETGTPLPYAELLFRAVDGSQEYIVHATSLGYWMWPDRPGTPRDAYLVLREWSADGRGVMRLLALGRVHPRDETTLVRLVAR